MRTGIRFKTILTVFPIILASLAFIGSTSILSARSGMVRLAMDSLSFKAEMLQQYAESQWQLLVSQGYAEDEEFRQAVARSIQEYGRALMRQRTEWVVAVDLDGQPRFSVTRSREDPEIGRDLIEVMRTGRTGPVIFGSGPGKRYGQAFYFGPLEWYVVVSNSESSIFAETDRSTSTILFGFAVSLILSLILLVLITGSIVKPITRVSDGMTQIIRSNNFDSRIAVTTNDEVGLLTQHFNSLCRELGRSYKRIQDIALRELDARFEIADRELQAIIALGKVAEFRDEETASHTIRVGLYSQILAEVFLEDEEERRNVIYAAPLHDIGKIGIPDSILLKPAALTPEEFAVMKTHAAIGHSILQEFKNPALAMGAEIALSHHERFDGKGYPRGLSGTDIPLCGRILAIVDVFDAMTSERPYKKAWPADNAFSYIEEQRGLHFDPEIARVFLEKKQRVLSIKEKNQ